MEEGNLSTTTTCDKGRFTPACSEASTRSSTASSSSSPSSSSFGEEEEEEKTGCCVHRCLAALDGHQGTVASIALAGDLLYTASQGGDIRVWRHPDLLQCGQFGVAAAGAVKSILVGTVMNNTHNFVITAHQDHRIRVWNTKSVPPGPFTQHKLVATLPTFPDRLRTCISPRNYIQSRRHHRRLWIQHVDTISALAISDTHLYSASWDKTFKVWALPDFRCVDSVKAHHDAINALLLLPPFVYTASADCSVKAWLPQPTTIKKKKTKKHTREKHALAGTMHGHESAVNAMVFLAPSRILLSGSSDGSILAWDSLSFDRLSATKAHRLAVLCLTAVGDLAFSGSADKTIRVWKTARKAKMECLSVLEGGHQGPVKSLSTSANLPLGYLVYSGGTDKAIKVWWVSSSSSSSSSSSDAADSSSLLSASPW